ncbi:TPA: PepSY-associated TM helix domain-containing protein, partial [Pseudomonas aeruginosa]
VFVDPADGRWLGARARAACCLEAEHVIPFVWALHHRLMLPGVWGWWFMGGIALLWLFDTFVGTYLTLPRHRPFWQKWQVAWKIKPQAGGYRRHLDLHRAGGLWCWLLVFVLAFSSVYLNLREELFKPVVSVFSTLTQPPAGAGADTAVSRPVIGFEQARRLANEEAERQGWTARTSGVSHWREPGIYLALLWPSHSNRGLGLGEPMVYLDAYTGRVLQVTQPGKGSAGDVLVALQFPLHSGQIAGLTGRIVVALMGLLIAMLAVTGVVIWQRKRTARQPAGRGKSVKQAQRP